MNPIYKLLKLVLDEPRNDQVYLHNKNMQCKEVSIICNAMYPNNLLNISLDSPSQNNTNLFFNDFGALRPCTQLVILTSLLGLKKPPPVAPTLTEPTPDVSFVEPPSLITIPPGLGKTGLFLLKASSSSTMSPFPYP
jgi:hypothetical protein